jgi:hypothetical protein
LFPDHGNRERKLLCRRNFLLFGGFSVKKTAGLLLAILAATTITFGQDTSNTQPASASTTIKIPKRIIPPLKPFSRIALSGGVGLMGVNLQIATNLNQHLNLRGIGNFFDYTVDNISTNGFNVTGQVNMATAGVSLDYYPAAKHGFRVSPGVMFYNQNHVNANVVAAGGTSFTLNDTDYYSSATDPVGGTASVGLNTQNPAFTITTGWGDMIPRKGGHISFPFELGAVFTDVPTINAALTQGEVCDSLGRNCASVVGDPTLNSSLQAELAKYRSDLSPAKAYPILTFGISYAFRIR